MLAPVGHSDTSDPSGLVDELGRWRLPVEGGTVTQLLIDYAFGFTVQVQEPAGDVRMRLAGRFSYEDGSGRRFEIDPEAPDTLPPLLALHQAVVSEAHAVKDGHLVVRFEDGRSIEVAPDDRYEAWQVDGSRPRYFVSPQNLQTYWERYHRPDHRRHEAMETSRTRQNAPNTPSA